MINGVVYNFLEELVSLKEKVAELEARLPKPFQYTRYVNIYEYGHGAQMFATEDAARDAANLYGYRTYGRYVKTVKVVIGG